MFFGLKGFLTSIALGIFLFTTSAQGTSIAPVKIENLFAQADQIALVKVLSGDSEHYSTAVYKAIVETDFKGTVKGQILFFGPYTGYSVGTEYLLFLKRGSTQSANIPTPISYGLLPSVSTIMYEGYAALPVGYECVFDGADTRQICDDSVQLNPEQIILPKTINTFPAGDATAITNYRKWVRKDVFLSLLHP